jgi:uncharacterized ion transporter superfamily protein YfcC
LSKQRTLDPLLLIGSIIVLATSLTWVLPAGRFERTTDPQTHRTIVVPGSYKSVARHPVGPWGALVSIPEGLSEAAEVVFFVLLAGGALTVVEGTGAIGSLLNHLMSCFGGHPLPVLGFASILFLIGGASNNMYEEILAFIPLLCALTRRLGLNHEMALAISVGTAVVAAVFSPFNTFTLGISQPMAQVSLFSGFAFRSVVFVLAIGIWSAYLAWYALRFRVEIPPTDQALSTHAGRWKLSDIWVLVVMNAGMAAMILGGVFLRWELLQFSAIWVLMAIVAGWVGGLGWRGTSEQFAEGLRRMAVAAALVGFARSISVVLRNGLVLDTIANALFSPLSHLSRSLSAATMLVSESFLAFPMPSDSGRAMMSLPVTIPLADLLGLSRQMVVIAYQYSGLVSGLITPTAGAFLAMLALAGISYGKWIRFMMVPFALLFALALVAIVAGVRLGVQ